jgi:hypothetical protein
MGLYNHNNPEGDPIQENTDSSSSWFNKQPNTKKEPRPKLKLVKGNRTFNENNDEIKNMEVKGNHMDVILIKDL